MSDDVVFDEVPLYQPPVVAELEHVRVIHCILFHKNKILLLQRNQGMRYYPGYWSGVCGVVDEHISLKDKVSRKIEEETGITKGEMKIVVQKNPIEYAEKVYGKIWEITPILAEVDPKGMHFDWNCQDHAWVTPEEALDYNVVPGFKEVLHELFPTKVK